MIRDGAAKVEPKGESQHQRTIGAISTIFCIVSKNQNRATARKAITTLLGYVSPAVLDERTVLHGLAFDFEDMEDALVAAIAQRERARAIITRNVRDFASSPIPVATPGELLALMARG